jgi:hypothetical protein
VTTLDLAATADEANQLVAEATAHLAAHPRGFLPRMHVAERVQGLVAYNQWLGAQPDTTFA